MLIQYGRKMTCRMRLTPCRKPDRRFAEPLLSSGLGFASRGGLQQAQTLATDLFRVLTAFSLIFELQARPLTGAQGLEVGRPEPQSGAGCGASKARSGRHICASKLVGDAAAA
jgi:hypothetical protein